MLIIIQAKQAFTAKGGITEYEDFSNFSVFF